MVRQGLGFQDSRILAAVTFTYLTLPYLTLHIGDFVTLGTSKANANGTSFELLPHVELRPPYSMSELVYRYTLRSFH